MITILAFIFVLGILVFVHELGHFFAARSIGVRVDRFSLGFPPRLITFFPTEKGWILNLFFYHRNEEGKVVWGPVFKKLFARIPKKLTGTEYCVALIPLGGYVKMAGAIDESLDEIITGAPDELASQSRLKQAWVMIAGVLMNVVLAVLLFSGITFFMGIPEITNEPVVMEVKPDYPAQEAGIQAGDRILTINEQEIESWQALTDLVHSKPNQVIAVKWQREDEIFSTEILTTEVSTQTDEGIEKIGLIGITGGYVNRDAGIIESFQDGVSKTGFWFGIIGRSLKMLVTGEASLKEIGGPILIAQLAGESARAGFSVLLSFMAVISINLAFLNILPIPGLDGGHLFIILIESIGRRAISIKTRMVIQQVGMALLFLLMLVVVFNDISRLFAN